MTPSLDISQLGNPILRQVAQPIALERYQATDLVNDQVRHFISQLQATMTSANGVGIAAPQVGVSQRLIIVASRPNLRYPHAPTMAPTPMINPRLISHSDELEKDWEGCLSIPGIRGLVPRYQAIIVEYTSSEGQLQQLELTGFVARIVQHELDHLDGLVFLDRVERTQDLVTEQEYMRQVLAGS